MNVDGEIVSRVKERMKDSTYRFIKFDTFQEIAKRLSYRDKKMMFNYETEGEHRGVPPMPHRGQVMNDLWELSEAFRKLRESNVRWR